MIFNYCSKTRIIFGRGRHKEIGEICKIYGERCILIAPTSSQLIKNTIEKVIHSLCEKGIYVKLFQSVKPNPSYEDTISVIKEARIYNPDFVVALGGGSTIDTAKMIAYCCYMDDIKQKEIYNPSIKYNTVTKENHRILPLIALPTTAGTGSQCTQAAVITTPNGIKETIFRQAFFPEVTIVDSELCDSMPLELSRSTGFDAFCHLSESYINGHLAPFAEVMALYGLEKIGKYMPLITQDVSVETRDNMSLSDTLGGICLSNGGACVPHMIAELVTSYFPRISHGISLSIVYPLFVKHFFKTEYENRINTVLNKLGYTHISTINDAFESISDFVNKIGMSYHLHDFVDNEEAINDFKIKVKEINRFDKTIIDRMLEEIW